MFYINHRNYDWYLKADDDTFIFNDNLRLFLADKNQNDPVTFGHHLKGHGGYLSGGAGYVLSKESLQRLGSKLITNQKYCPNIKTTISSAFLKIKKTGQNIKFFLFFIFLSCFTT